MAEKYKIVGGLKKILVKNKFVFKKMVGCGWKKRVWSNFVLNSDTAVGDGGRGITGNNTPRTRGGPGGRDRILAVKRRKSTQTQFFFQKSCIFTEII